MLEETPTNPRTHDRENASGSVCMCPCGCVLESRSGMKANPKEKEQNPLLYVCLLSLGVLCGTARGRPGVKIVKLQWGQRVVRLMGKNEISAACATQQTPKKQDKSGGCVIQIRSLHPQRCPTSRNTRPDAISRRALEATAPTVISRHNLKLSHSRTKSNQQKTH